MTGGGCMATMTGSARSGQGSAGKSGWLAVATSALFVTACDAPPYIPPKEETDTLVTTDGDTTTDDSDTATDTDTTANCGIEPKLSSISAKYFQLSCVFGGCHEAASQEGDLNLDAASLHAVLVNVAAADKKAGPRGKLRVVPGNPDASFLVQKLEGTQARDEGGIMPDGADEPIDPECRIKMVRQWILDGALDN